MTSAVAVEGASLTLGAFRLRHLDLALDAGEILVILGPNGAGKSVSLEMTAGFHRPAAGRIVINGRDVTDLPPERRRVGLMFQNFGLFPHLTVAENIAFGLRARRARAPDAARDPAELLAQFGIAHLGERTPETLSPGEKQRVALARVLVVRPDLLLLDEPFSALDARTREELREELKLFIRRAGIPAIFVTHDQTDAFVLADRIAVMHQGAILQTGTVAEIYRKPADAFVAAFIGVENILLGRLVSRSAGLCRFAVAGHTLLVQDDASANDMADALLCIRAEDVVLAAPTDAAPALNRLTGRVVAVTPLGALTKAAVDCGFPLTAYLTSRGAHALGLAPGHPIVAEIEAGAIHLLKPPIPAATP